MTYRQNTQMTEEQNRLFEELTQKELDIDTIKSIITQNPEIVDVADSEGLTLLHHAAINERTDFLEFLIEKEADLNTIDPKQWTPLHFAAFNGSTEVVKLLIKNNADVDVKDFQGNNSLHFAASNGYTDIVRSLVTKVTKINVKNDNGATPLNIAGGYIIKEIIEKEINTRLEESKRLLQNLSEVNSAFQQETTGQGCCSVY